MSCTKSCFLHQINPFFYLQPYLSPFLLFQNISIIKENYDFTLFSNLQSHFPPKNCSFFILKYNCHPNAPNYLFFLAQVWSIFSVLNMGSLGEIHFLGSFDVTLSLIHIYIIAYRLWLQHNNIFSESYQNMYRTHFSLALFL